MKATKVSVLKQWTNKVIQGDCLELMRYLPDDCVDLVLTDPPYGLNYKSSWTDVFDKIVGDVNLDWVEPFFAELHRITKPDCAFYIYTRFDSIPEFMFELRKFTKIYNLIVVPRTQLGGTGSLKSSFAPQNEFIIYAVKGNKPLQLTSTLKPSLRYRRDFCKKNVPEYLTRLPDYWHWCKAGIWNNDRVHPTQKDISALETAIKCSSVEGDVVFDPFVGSGSTAVAAKTLNRNFIGFEIDEDYVQIAGRRLINTGLASKAERMEANTALTFEDLC